MTVWRIALERPPQSRGEVWRQTLRWRSGGSPPPVRRLCPRHSFGGGDGPARGADGRAPGPKAPSQHRPRRWRGTIACTTGTAPGLGGSPDCPAIARRRAAKGEPGAGAERSGTVRFEHGCDRVGPRGACHARWSRWREGPVRAVGTPALGPCTGADALWHRRPTRNVPAPSTGYRPDKYS